jgi:hypothetical protein
MRLKDWWGWCPTSGVLPTHCQALHFWARQEILSCGQKIPIWLLELWTKLTSLWRHFNLKAKEGHCIACLLRWIVRTEFVLHYDANCLPPYQNFHLCPCVGQDCDGRRGLGADARGTNPKEGRKKASIYARLCWDQYKASTLAFTDKRMNTIYIEGTPAWRNYSINSIELKRCKLTSSLPNPKKINRNERRATLVVITQ